MEVNEIPKAFLPPLTCGMLAEANFGDSWGAGGAGGGVVHTKQRLRVNAVFDVSNVGGFYTLHVLR